MTTEQHSQKLVRVEIAAARCSALRLEYISILKKEIWLKSQLGAFHPSQCSSIYFSLSFIVQYSVSFSAMCQSIHEPINH